MTKHDTLLLACGTPENRQRLRSILEENYNLLESANTPQTILLLEQNIQCVAAVLLDITNPEVLRQDLLTLPAATKLLEQVPVIVITRDDSSQMLQLAFRFGAADAIPIHYDPYAFTQRLENIIQLHLHKRHLESLAEDQANILQHSNDIMVDALSSIIEYRSVESGQHVLRIRHFTKLLLGELVRCCPEYGLTDTDVSIISSAAALHDIGKIAIPDAILTKPGKLTPEEMEQMKTHCLTGCRILQRIGALGNQDYLRYAHNICHYHHERWDGSGYPEGLAGDNIPICAQAVGLADVYDALTTKRVYKDAYSFDTAVNMILKGDCGAFSPKLLECFKHVTGDFEALARSYADGLAPDSESFDVTLPPPDAATQDDGMERTWAKYQALVHYVNVFLLELDLDHDLFHLIYNPYPELLASHNASTLHDLKDILLEDLVIPAQRQEMEEFIHQGLDSFLAEGLRRIHRIFRFRSADAPQGQPFEITLLRINPRETTRRTLAMLLRKVSESPSEDAQPAPDIWNPADYIYRCRYNSDFSLISLDPPCTHLMGYTQEELHALFGGRLLELALPEDRQQILRGCEEQFRVGKSLNLEYRMRHKDGSVIWVLDKSRLVLDSQGQEYLHCFLFDISHNKQHLDTLNDQLSRYEIILAQTENVLFEWDTVTDRISFSNTWEQLFGFQPQSTSVRAALSGGSYFHPDDLPRLFDPISNLENGSNYEAVEVRIASAKGHYIWCRFRASAIRDDDGNLKKIVGIIINIDAEKQAQQNLLDRADRDSLTKLLNKHAARKKAELYLRQQGQQAHCALLIIDLDNFKQVNDQYGHLFGDSVLTKVSAEIQRLFRSQDIIARIGGDEFMVLMRGISDRSLVESRCNQLIRALHSAFRNPHYELPLSCSIGVALAPEHGSVYVDLFKYADQALYQAKDRGKNTFVFYDPQHFPAALPQRNLTAINNRIDSDEEPGMANGSIVQYAFQRLYTSQDVSQSINDILDMIGRQLNVSRVYIFENSPDNRFCSNTYEWCNEGIPPEIENLQNISYETDIPDYEQNFNEQGIFYCPDITVLPKKTYDIVAPQGIKSMLHCAIREGSVFRGYIGFDECVTQRFWTKEQIQVLTYFSEMLSVFLLKKQAQEKIAQRATELASILDNQNAWLYIIDPDTCRLKYLNKKTRELAPSVQPGDLCYKALMGLDSRCPGCPARNIRKHKNRSTTMENKKFNLTVQADATLITWEGEESCLLNCRLPFAESPDTED